MSVITDGVRYLMTFGGATALKQKLEKTHPSINPLLSSAVAYPLPGLAAQLFRKSLMPPLGVTLPNLKPQYFPGMRSSVYLTKVRPFLSSGARSALVSGVYASALHNLQKDNDLTPFGKVFIGGVSGGMSGMSLSTTNYLSALLKRQNPRGYNLFTLRPYTQLVRSVPIRYILEGVKSTHPRALAGGAVAGLTLETLKLLLK